MKGHVRTIEFSGPTYQVEVVDPKSGESIWPFIQYDERGGLKDAFCSCDSQQEQCVHLKEALKSICDKDNEPLHLRFERSFWFHLSKYLSDPLGYEIGKEGDHYKLSNQSLSFVAHPKSDAGKKLFTAWIELSEKATPENSIKFSALPADEIGRWREGRPSRSLRFELSFWSEMARWMFLQKSYVVKFQEDEKDLPTRFTIDFKHFLFEITLNQEALVALIPYLATIEAPLKVRGGLQEEIEAVTFDPKGLFFSVRRKAIAGARSDRPQVPLDGWIYVRGEGFYARKGSGILGSDTITDVEALLTNHLEEVLPYLEGVAVDVHPHKFTYSMHFDKKWQWHFHAELFGGSVRALFGNWAFVEGKGFFRVEEALFDTVETILSPKQVASFVNRNRIWLSSKEGFSTHLSSVEASLTFEIDPKGRLCFQTKIADSVEAKDFGEWIYYRGMGFFSKRQTRTGLAVKPGLVIEGKNVSSFINAHQEELEWIPGFFALTSPIEKRGVKLILESPGVLLIEPHCEPEDPSLSFYGEYVFQKERGFFKLPAAMRLGSDYEAPRRIEEKMWPRFFDEEWPHLKSVALLVDSRLLPPHKMELHVHYLARRPEGGVRAELVFTTEKGSVHVSVLQEAMREGRAFVLTEAGRIDLRDERFQWIGRLPPGKMHTLELSTLEFLRIDALEGIGSPPDIVPTAVITRSLLTELRSLRVSQSPDLKGLKSTLRLYQQTGLQWLWFLYHHGLGGLLCDEMGLGKTHQAMALIAASLNLKEKRAKRYLVVCPTSVIYHWEDKLAAFLPGLKVHTFHGQKRSLKNLPKEGLILTSYGILRLEKSRLKEMRFEIAVFDEIQVAKNAHSRVHDALATVDSHIRIGLTGTPIENRLLELKALFDLVLPGLMPAEKRFRDLFVNPIERDLDEEKRALLSKLINPFILRRRKAEVLEELPEKSEDKSYCDLSDEQKRLYIQTLDQRREELVADLRDTQTPVPYVHIFSVLSTLKQICNHPALVAKDPKNYKKYPSGKWDLFIELLDEARESEQKVVVFSQYLYMLDIIELYLKEQGMGYAQIRGDTIDRREQLRRFQQDPDCVVFIGSLQAAGVGIDLTAASVVILYDRWWNAARENQAIDRVHRIGQKWGVQVFKLITKHTIEEKIDNLITKKGRLMERVIEADDQAELKTFTRSDLIDLLSL